jgi:hypothetical protein
MLFHHLLANQSPFGLQIAFVEAIDAHQGKSVSFLVFSQINYTIPRNVQSIDGSAFSFVSDLSISIESGDPQIC